MNENHGDYELSHTQVKIKRATSPLVQPIESAELISLFLKRLEALQERAHNRNKASKRSRRLVIGMHEVRRGLLCRKIVLLVVATDFDGFKAVKLR
ncbi:uncharacterized protein PHALS_07337 [Plasmopara halstedii]|uniref:Uncharacterized protein n=1 Tax=Plasmopara halstedii TaxID=4781 RepID=A0A0N7L8D6_PLAHL|nr:uncharacterized protein PHALS_07337 [Plasmopara halstedii]CEG49579.1 hypothetical protein PHALS_07337 [Plasmopara halstedii]|eukprot:XP_024585948.1 hypothetical protein PHALS_07337 [Plasmopara halstedii]